MGESKEIQDRVYESNFSFQDKEQPTHFFQRFSSDKTQVSISNERPPEVDLNLRLSLGGIYSTGNTMEKHLSRSSSIGGKVTLEKNFRDQFEKSLPKSFLSLARSCSLPAEVERSHNKKVVNVKELRIMRRVEAKKRAEEKQRNAMKGSDKEKLLIMEGEPSSTTKLPAWAAASAAKSPALHRAICRIKEGCRKL